MYSRILFVLVGISLTLIGSSVFSQHITAEESNSPKSAIVDWMERTSSVGNTGNYDLNQIQLKINEIQLSHTPKLILVDFTLENNNVEKILLRGGAVIDLRTFDPIKFESEPKRQAPNFDNSYNYLIPEKIESGFGNVDFANKCERLDLIVNPSESGRSVLCFNPNYETLLPDTSTVEYYLVLSNRPANSCPFCEIIFLNDKVTNDIPDWIKNNAKWWSLNQISNQDFAKGLEYLIENNIIQIPKNQSSEGASEIELPSWLRKNAGWWSQGLLSDKEFVESIQWMINNGFIKI